mmetsp:Transcript_67249/g.117055  ORF Transcript_67249/g.117055 Transcript_67249/m.117055 type:complete len:237 (+) Transcript_67249:1-711(+)
MACLCCSTASGCQLGLGRLNAVAGAISEALLSRGWGADACLAGSGPTDPALGKLGLFSRGDAGSTAGRAEVGAITDEGGLTIGSTPVAALVGRSIRGPGIVVMLLLDRCDTGEAPRDPCLKLSPWASDVNSADKLSVAEALPARRSRILPTSSTWLFTARDISPRRSCTCASTASNFEVLNACRRSSNSTPASLVIDICLKSSRSRLSMSFHSATCAATLLSSPLRFCSNSARSAE